jgi:hypothetical protein
MITREFDFAMYPVNPVGLLVMPIVAQLIFYEQKDDHASRNSYGQAGHVDESVEALLR